MEFYKTWICDCGKKNLMITKNCNCNRKELLAKWKLSMEKSCICECGAEKSAGRDMCRKCNPFEYTNPIEYVKK